MRHYPLNAGSLLLQLSLIWFMLAEPFWCLVASRVLQGLAKSIVWVAGISMLNENIDEKRTGLYIGLVMSGNNIGEAFGPALGMLLLSHPPVFDPD